MRVFTQIGWLTLQAVIFSAVLWLMLSGPETDRPSGGLILMGALFSAWFVTFTISVLTDLTKLAIQDTRRWRAQRRQKRMQSSQSIR